jgi:oligopeptide transport system substrate-binding protein
MNNANANLLRPSRLVLTMLIGLLAAIAIACGSGGGQASTKEVPNQTFRMRVADDPSSFDPQLAYAEVEISVAKQLFRGLFTYDQDMNVVPALALEVPTKDNGGISDDGLTYTIKMRHDAKWSDGQPITAGDFAYALQRLFDPEAGAQGYYYGFYTSIAGASEASSAEGPVDAVAATALDDSTLQIKLTHPQPTLPTLLALWPASPLRKDLIDQNGAAWTDPGKLVGDGPFVLSDFVPNDHITLTANANYWGDDTPTLQTLVYRIIPDDSAAILAYKDGDIDMTDIPTTLAGEFEGDPEQIRYPQLETFALQYNNSASPLDNKLVRQAISRGVDRSAYVTTIQGGVGAPTTSWLPPGLPGYYTDIGQDFAFDVDAARSLLSQAGFPDGAGLPSVQLMIDDTPGNRLTADFFKQQLKENLGIDLSIEAVEEGIFFERYGAGDFQVTWLSWFADYGDPEDWLPAQFATDGSANVLHYTNPQVDDLLARAASEFNDAQRLDLYDQAHRLIIDDQALTPVFNTERNYLVKANIACLVTTPLDAEPGDWFVTSLRILEGPAPASC